MKFVAYEGLDAQIVERLRQAEHRVWYIAEMEPGISDDAVLNLANQENAVLLTVDEGFGIKRVFKSDIERFSIH